MNLSKTLLQAFATLCLVAINSYSQSAYSDDNVWDSLKKEVAMLC